MFSVGLDLATTTGIAIGDSRINHPSQIKSLSMRFRKPHEDFEMAGYNIERWLEQAFIGPLPLYQTPDIIIAEAMLPLAGQKSDDAGKVALSLHQGLYNFCYAYGIRLERVAASTVRKYFIGQGKAQPGQDIKLLVAQHCQRLGYTEYVLPKAKRDQTDAIACWSFGVAKFARVTPGGVLMMGAL
ncbi:hypothetical protein DK26_23330 [Bosea sp. WAO]|uniref:hypothetical protein n=1 Tax=Bosea sp. WAO TaxID=406341 RepID=UPI0007491379|nr:hypothetical protein [Bosea sp. WAO]KUL93455.1 hypothetical protein DK26_23330 [Bosea sp. WAO]